MSELNRIILGAREKLFRRRKTDENAISLPLSLSTDSRILVVLPETAPGNEVAQILQIADEYLNGFPVQFAMRADQAGHLPGDRLSLYYSDDTISLSGRLNSSLTANLASHSYQLAIDLNEDFRLLPALLCLTSRAPVRASFVKPRAPLYFNLLIRTNGEGFEEKTRKMFEQILALSAKSTVMA